MKTVEVVAAIIHLHGRILATQRGYGEHKGMWEFPGGKMEMGIPWWKDGNGRNGGRSHRSRNP